MPTAASKKQSKKKGFSHLGGSLTNYSTAAWIWWILALLCAVIGGVFAWQASVERNPITASERVLTSVALFGSAAVLAGWGAVVAASTECAALANMSRTAGDFDET